MQLKAQREYDKINCSQFMKPNLKQKNYDI